MHETVWGTVVNGGSKLKPQRHLFNQGIVACVTFMVPVFFVLYFITVPRGQWIPVVAGQVIVTVLFVLAAVAFFRVGIWVGPDGITERGFFGKVTTVDRADVGSVLLVETLDGGATATVPQLFVRGLDGVALVRMRGQFWSRKNMDRLIAELDAPVEHIEDYLSVGELRDDFPTLLYWFERHPVIAAVSIAAVAVVFVTALILLFQGGALPLA